MLTETIANGLKSDGDALTAALTAWRKVAEADLKGAPFEKKLITRTAEGIAIQPLYTRADIAGLSLGSVPGEAPFLRGGERCGYRGRIWEFAQEILAPTAGDLRSAVLAGLAGGQGSIILAPVAADVDVDTFRTVLREVALPGVPVHLDAGAEFFPIAATYLACAAEQKVPWDALTGSVTADPLAAWIRAGELPADISGEMDSLAGWTSWAATHAPSLRSVGVNARIWGDAGANAVQELAFALAGAVQYVGALQARGVCPEATFAKLRFQFAIGPTFFTEIAKFRAWRLLLTRVVAAHGAPPAVAAQTRVHAATGRWNKTLLDPHVNLLRVTTEALSAVLGGCDSLHIGPFDEPRGATDEFSRRIARNVHTLLADEFGFSDTADPAGGSWYVETLTDQLARKAWTLFQTIQARGGWVSALREGYPQRLVSETAAERADGVEKRRLPLIGTNQFPNPRDRLPPPTPPVPVRPGGATRRPAALPGIPAQAGWPERFEAAIAAARAGAGAPEIAALAPLQSKPGSSIARVEPFRAAAGFERLRALGETLAARAGHPPRVFLAKMGPPRQHQARAEFAATFFATGGFEVLASAAYDAAAAAAAAAAASGAAIAVLCSTDDTYPVLAPAFAVAAKAARPGLKVVLAGLPADPQVVDAFRAAGVDEFIHIRANAHAILARFLNEIGASV